MSSTIAIQGVYACASVTDFDGAVAWYGKFMGREPDDRPFPGMVQWRNMGAAGLQLWQEPDHAGKSRMTIVVPVMADERTRLAAAGLELRDELSGDFGKVAQLIDPEGNRITLTEPPKGFVNR